MRNKIPNTIVLMSIWLVLSGCYSLFDGMHDDPSILRGSGNVVVEYREVSSFNQVSIAISGDVTLKRSERERLSIETDDNLVEFIQTEVLNSKLFIRFANEVTHFQPSKPNRILLEFKDLQGLKTSGSSDVKSKSLIGEHLEIMLAGSGDIEIVRMRVDSLLVDLSGSGSILSENVQTENLGISLGGSGDVQFGILNADELDLEILGSGDVRLAGQVNRQHIHIPGSGDYEAGKLRSERTYVGMVATGSVTVWSEEHLSLRVFPGKGEVAFYGDPTLELAACDLVNIQRLGTR